MKVKKKPVEVEAIQFNGFDIPPAKLQELRDFIGEANPIYGNGELVINTLEGAMIARKGDWIIKEMSGEFYPVKPDIFEKIYETI